MTQRTSQLIGFLQIIDRFKSIERQRYTANGLRKENDAKHTWHMFLFALLLHKELNEEIDLLQSLKLILMHDLVEIVAGDTFAYDLSSKESQKAREQEAANVLFSHLPTDYREEFHSLWDEYSAGSTAEARFAKEIDRMQAFAQVKFR